MMAGEDKTPQTTRARGNWIQLAFVRLGVLPFLLLIAIVVFTLMSDNFLTTRNIVNVLRQSTYLTMVALGQMLALLTGGFDLSVGTMLALTSVVSATVMAGVYAAAPDMVLLAIIAGILAGLAAGLAIGVVNGIGVSLLNVSPFMMTLGMASVGFGAALYMTGGVPVYGMPDAFGTIFGFGKYLGVPTP
ncbi:MAG: ABC transporter permease, partial [Proteobacteria bacterium]|nr:ABC transporter permease [Pseudomonadota bacterium]